MDSGTETIQAGERLGSALTEALRMSFKYSEENANEIHLLRKKLARVLRKMRSLSTHVDEHLKAHAT